MLAGQRGRTFLLAAATLAVSAVGGVVAWLIGLPAAFLCGGAMAVTLASLVGMPATILTPVRNTVFVLIGMSMGATVSENTLSLIAQWPVSVAALMIGLTVIVTGTALILNRVFGIDRITSFLSSCPGHLSFIIGISESGRGNTRQIAVIQSIRVLILTIAVPIGAQLFSAGDLAPPARAASMDILTLTVLAACCAAGGMVLTRFKVPAGYVLGSMIVATTGKLMGLYHDVVPSLLVTCGFIFMGALIGSRFVGVSARELRQSVSGGLVVSLMAIGVVSFAALVVSRLVALPYGQVWIGLAPGGLETMGALGIAFGYDTAFIAAHHALRLLVLGFAIPLVSGVLMKRPEPH